MSLDEITSKVTNEAGSVLGWVAAAAASIWVGFQRLRRVTSADQDKTEQNDANRDIVARMREEVDRLSAQNARLTRVIEELQTEVFHLRDENASLRRHLGLSVNGTDWGPLTRPEAPP